MNHFITNPPGLESRIGLFTFNGLPEMQQLSSDIGISYNGLDVEFCSALTSISYPNLSDIDPLNVGFGYVWISDHPLLNTVSFPKLQHCSGDITVASCDVISSVAFPELVTVGGNVVFDGNPLCTSVSIPKLQTTVGDCFFGKILPNPASDGALTSIQLDAFTDCGGKITVSQLASLTSFSAPLFETAFEGVSFRSLPSITTIALPSFQSIDPTVAVFGPLEIIDCPALTAFAAPVLGIVAGAITVTECPSLTFLNFSVMTLSWGPLTFRNNPACVSIDFSSLLSTGYIYIGEPTGFGPPNDGALTSINFDSLSQALVVQILQCNAITSVSFPSLPSCASGLNISDNPALTSVSLPNWSPIGSQQVALTSNALDVTSVNNILIQCAAAIPGFTGPVALFGGTNAAPTGAGITAKNALIANGNSVATN